MKEIKLTNDKKAFILLLFIAIGIRVFAMNQNAIESFYSGSAYTYIGTFFRLLFGWIPFSIGDVMYICAVLYIIMKLVYFIKNLRVNQFSSIFKRDYFLSFLNKLLIIYIFFNLCWGLNYDRLGISYQLKIEKQEYSKENLMEINELLVQKVNECKAGAANQIDSYDTPEKIFVKTHEVYKKISTQYPFLLYKSKSIKSSFFGKLGNYMGFSGYYNPFSGEAQVNTTIPQFLQPYVSCHEVAHQLGYAKENEANFVGYIAATASGDSSFMYSAYLDMFLYANRNLRRTDSLSAKQYSQKLNHAVQQDVQSIKDFYSQYQNPVEPYISWLYGKYLESNRQPSGMLSYSEVVGDLIGYYKKYGKIGG